MKKLYSSIFILAFAVSANAQVVPGADMETWRTGSANSGTFPVRTIHAPFGWVGFDSLVIYMGEYFASIPLFGFGNGNNYYPQLFPETTIVHGGTHSAKMITMKQDTLGGMFGGGGYIPGSLANYHTNFAMVGTTPSFTTTGGLHVTERMHSVSAWVQYKYNSTTLHDTAVLSVEAIKRYGTVDSVIGSGSINIDTSSVWQQVTANIVYNMFDTIPDTIRITFASSRSGVVDSSTLYVDDVTMMTAVGVESTILTNEIADIYPNPAKGVLNINCNFAGNLRFELFSIGGQLVASKNISGNDVIDVSMLPTGLYFYNISDITEHIVQKGKLNVMH